MILQFLATAIFAQLGQSVNIPVKNPSFEQLNSPLVPFSPCESRAPYDNPDWIFEYDSEIIKPCITPPDGSNAVLVQNSRIYQDTGVKPSDLQPPGVGGATGLYEFKFWVANYFTVYPGYYEADITIGTIDPVTKAIKGHELCSADGWATQHFIEVMLMCPSPDYLLGKWPDELPGPADPNAHIIVSLSHTKGWQLLFDNVSLTFTPSN